MSFPETQSIPSDFVTTSLLTPPMLSRLRTHQLTLSWLALLRRCLVCGLRSLVSDCPIRLW
jgi:hypothetical protein